MRNVPTLGILVVFLLFHVSKIDAEEASSASDLLTDSEFGCGQTLFTNASGSISLPRNSVDNTRTSVNCTYVISAIRTSKISLNVSNIERQTIEETFRNCLNESIMISCVSGNRSANYCLSKSSVIPSTPVFRNCRLVEISVRSQNYNIQELVEIPYTVSEENGVPIDKGCGNTSFSGPIGIITSPGYPSYYQDNLNCVYTLEVGRENTVDFYFMSFFIEGIPGICAQDWLTFSCLLDESNATTNSSSESSIIKLCGKTMTVETLTFSNCSEMRLNFFTDAAGTEGRFKIQYIIKQTDSSTSNATDKDIPDLDCGDTTFVNSSGVMTLPTNPTSYLARVNCNYTISTDRTSKISLNVSSFEMRQLIDSYRNCTSEDFKVGCVSERTSDFSPATGRIFCIHDYPIYLSQLVFPNCRHLKLSIRSSNYEYQRVVRIPFTVVANDEACGKTSFIDPAGEVSSPRFPLTYPHDLNCVYSIEVGRMKTISLVFLSFDLQGRSNSNSTDYCIRDWLTVSCSSDGSTGGYQSLSRKYCGLKTTPLKFSFSYYCSAVILNFVTDSSGARRGFKAQYIIEQTDEDCGNTSFTDINGVISSPRYPLTYPPSFNCIYSINVGRMNTITLYFLSFNLDGRSSKYGADYCIHDWLKITCSYDGSTGWNASSSSTYCGLKVKTRPVQISLSNCSAVILNFVSDSYEPGGQFKIQYIIKETEKDCGNTSFTDPTGDFASPNFPLSYPHSMNCTYSIEIDRMKTISLLLSFDLERALDTDEADDCPHDWLTVGCSSGESSRTNPSLSRKYCGLKIRPLKLTFSNCSAVRLNFVTDSAVSHGGFRVKYQISPPPDSVCGAPIHNRPSGVIRPSLNYTDYWGGFDCVYFINATEPSSISLTIWSISLQSSVAGNCENEFLLINCLDGQTELDHKVTNSSCNYLNSSTVITFPRCATVKVVFQKVQEATGKTFRIEYTTVNGYEALNPYLPTTAALSSRDTLETRSICATGCEISSDGTYCECILTPASTTLYDTKSVTSDVPITVRTSSDEFVVKTHVSSIASVGGSFLIPIAVLVIVIISIFIVSLSIRGRLRSRQRQDILLQEIDGDVSQIGSENGNSTTGGNQMDDLKLVHA